MREVAEGLQGNPDIRQLAVAVLKNLIIKHAMDDRYTSFKASINSYAGSFLLEIKDCWSCIQSFLIQYKQLVNANQL